MLSNLICITALYDQSPCVLSYLSQIWTPGQ